MGTYIRARDQRLHRLSRPPPNRRLPPSNPNLHTPPNPLYILRPRSTYRYRPQPIDHQSIAMYASRLRRASFPRRYSPLSNTGNFRAVDYLPLQPSHLISESVLKRKITNACCVGTITSPPVPPSGPSRISCIVPTLPAPLAKNTTTASSSSAILALIAFAYVITWIGMKTKHVLSTKRGLIRKAEHPSVRR
jgi:hypothetical protein